MQLSAGQVKRIATYQEKRILDIPTHTSKDQCDEKTKDDEFSIEPVATQTRK